MDGRSRRADIGPQAVQPVVAADNEGMDGKSGSTTEPRVVELGEQATVVVAGVVPVADLGNCESLADSWGRLAEWAAASGLAPRAPQWEIYVTELYWAIEP